MVGTTSNCIRMTHDDGHTRTNSSAHMIQGVDNTAFQKRLKTVRDFDHHHSRDTKFSPPCTMTHSPTYTRISTQRALFK